MKKEKYNNDDLLTTVEVKRIYSIKSTKTIKTWQETLSFPQPICQGQGRRHVYLYGDLKKWELQQKEKAA